MLRERPWSEVNKQSFTKCDSVGQVHRWMWTNDAMHIVRGGVNDQGAREHQGERLVAEEIMPVLHQDHQAVTRIMRDRLS